LNEAEEDETVALYLRRKYMTFFHAECRNAF
jgi:hypothetical protein